MPRRAVADARGPAPLRRRRADPAGGAVGGGGHRLRDARVGGRTGRRAAAARRARSADSRAAIAFLVCELWRAVVETKRRSSWSTDALLLTRPLSRAGDARERARGRQPAARAAGAEDDRCCWSWRRRREASSSSAVARRGSGLDEPRAGRRRLTRRFAAGSSRSCSGHRLAYRFTHELVRRAVYDRLSGVTQGGAAPAGR